MNSYLYDISMKCKLGLYEKGKLLAYHLTVYNETFCSNRRYINQAIVSYATCRVVQWLARLPDTLEDPGSILI